MGRPRKNPIVENTEVNETPEVTTNETVEVVEKPAEKPQIIYVEKEVEKKIEYKNFLSKRIVKLEPIEVKIFSGQQLEQLPDGFIHEGATRSLELRRNDVTGRFEKIFDDSEKFITEEFPNEALTELQWFSKMIGIDLNPNKKDDNYWAGYMDKNNPTLNKKPYEVKLPREGCKFDLSNIDDMIKYKVLCTWHGKRIAPTWENRYDIPSYWFAMVDEKVAVDRKKEAIQLERKAAKEFDKIADHRDLLIEFLTIKDPDHIIGSSASTEFLFNQVYQVLKDSPKVFLTIVEDPDRDDKILVFKACKAGALKKSGDKYYSLADEPLGRLGEVIGRLRDPQRIEFRKKLEYQIDTYRE